MATSTNLKPLNVSVRISRMHREKLWELLFSRYPENEWGSFIRFGWRESHYGLILTVNFIDAPLAGDIDTQSEVTEFKGQYTRRIIRGIDKHLFGVGVVHSHPEGYSTFPSLSDDNMEAYFANLFAGYIANRPFASLIFSKSGDIFSGSGRVWWKDNWYEVDRFIIENCPVRLNDFTRERRLSPEALKRTARLASQFSIESAEALADSTVAVMGLSGTGSPIVELLVRAGVGKFIVVDPKVFDDSNFERNHFSTKNDIGKGEPKSLIAKRFIKSLNPRKETKLLTLRSGC